MEIIEATVILSVLGAVLSGVMITIFRLFPQKTAKKALDRTIIDNNKIIQEQIDGIKQRYESELRSKAKRIKDLEGPETDEEEMPIPPELLAPIAKKLNMQPAALMAFVNSPQGKKLLKQYKDLIPAIPALLGGLGNGQGNNQNQVPQTF